MGKPDNRIVTARINCGDIPRLVHFNLLNWMSCVFQMRLRKKAEQDASALELALEAANRVSY